MRTQKILVVRLTILIIAIAAQSAMSQEFAQKKGDYLGQTPPGVTPAVFLELPGKYIQDVDISPDGKEIFFVESNKDWNDFILFSIRQQDDGTWTEPVKASFLGELDGALRPYFSPDGQRLYFISKTPRDIWVAHKTQDGWATAVKLDSPINSEEIEHSAFESADQVLWFCSHRKISESKGACDLYYAKIENGKYLQPVNLDMLNTEQNDCAIVISPDGKYLLFHSNRPGGVGGADLYVAVKDDQGNLSAPKNLGEQVNTAGMEVIAHFSPDGKHILFTRRAGAQTNEPSKVYWVSVDILKNL